VSIVASNSETLDGLQTYLQQAGVPSHSTRAVQDLAMGSPEFATVTIFFPDDFAESDALKFLGRLREHRPHVLVLLITRQPDRFRKAIVADGKSTLPIILPKPSFGWDILDVIRAHDAGRSSS
jgi:hypothetical protein